MAILGGKISVIFGGLVRASFRLEVTGSLLQPSKSTWGKVTSPPFLSICPFSQWRTFSTRLSNSNSIRDENRLRIGTYRKETVINRITVQNTKTLPHSGYFNSLQNLLLSHRVMLLPCDLTLPIPLPCPWQWVESLTSSFNLVGFNCNNSETEVGLTLRRIQRRAECIWKSLRQIYIILGLFSITDQCTSIIFFKSHCDCRMKILY